MSVHSFNAELVPPNEINQLLDERYVKANTVKSIETFQTNFLKRFSDIQFVPDVKYIPSASQVNASNSNLSDTINEFGTRIYFYAADLIENQDSIIRAIVYNNTPLNTLELQCLDRRYKLDDDKASLEGITRQTPIEPNHEFYNIKARKAIVEYKSQLERQFRQMLTEDQFLDLPTEEFNFQLENYINKFLPKFSAEIKDKFDFEYSDEYENYVRNMKLKSNSTQQLASVQQKHDREVILEKVIQTYSRAISSILQL